MDQITECLHRPDHCRYSAVAVYLQLKNIADSIVCCPAQLTEEFPVIPEINPQPFRYREYPLPVWYDSKHFILEPEGKQQ
jgi:hypothetical protein